VTLRVIRVFTAAFPDRAFKKAASCRSRFPIISHSDRISAIRIEKRLKRRAVAQRRCNDSHGLEEARACAEAEVIGAWSKILGDFIAAHSAPVAREGILYARVLRPASNYRLDQVSKREILRKLKQRFGGKTIRDIRFRVG
jgi:hypothetical protein